MSDTFFRIRTMEPGDIAGGMRLSAAEGWNQSESDWKIFVEGAGNRSLVAEYNNEVIGTTGVIKYGQQLAWIGMVLVDKAYRGKGVSSALLRDTLEHLGAAVSIKLDATPVGQPVYSKFGFYNEYTIQRLIRPAAAIFTGNHSSEQAVLPMREENITDIIALDQQTFGSNRATLLRYLFHQFPGKAWMIKRKEQITGFALGRKGITFQHIGPLVATSPEDAISLVRKSAADLRGEPVVVDVLCDKQSFTESLLSAGFVHQRYLTRMYKNNNAFPGFPQQQFLIAGPEFG